MADDTYEVLLAIQVGEVEVEMMTTVEGGEATTLGLISLSEYAKEQLRNASLGNLKGAIESLLAALEITGVPLFEDFEAGLKKIPGVGDVLDAVLKADVYLTDLEYLARDHLTVGVLIKNPLRIDPLRVTRFGLKVTHPLGSAD